MERLMFTRSARRPCTGRGRGRQPVRRPRTGRGRGSKTARRPLSLHDFLRTLKSLRQLHPLLLEAAVHGYLREEARQQGLVVAAVELQQATNAFRRRHGMNSAEQTRVWLAEHHLSVLDLEDIVEEE